MTFYHLSNYYVPRILLIPFYLSTYFISKIIQCIEFVSITIPILQMREMELGETRQFTRGYTASKWQRPDEPRESGSRTCLPNTKQHCIFPKKKKKKVTTEREYLLCHHNPHSWFPFNSLKRSSQFL